VDEQNMGAQPQPAQTTPSAGDKLAELEKWVKESLNQINHRIEGVAREVAEKTLSALDGKIQALKAELARTSAKVKAAAAKPAAKAKAKAKPKAKAKKAKSAKKKR
jgi:hypothetical protein